MQRILFLLFFACAFFMQAGAQQGSSRADLERRRQALISSIRETQAQLAATKKDKKATLAQLNALQAKLDARQRLIGNINEEMRGIDGSIQNTTGEVTKLQGNLRDLQLRYAQSIRYAYRHRRSHNMLAFLFSSKDFNEGLRRLQYLKRFRNLRLAQADQIRQTQGQLQSKIGVLASEKNAKNMLLAAELQQKQVLQAEANETNQVVRELKGREAELAGEVAKAQKASRQLDRAISDIIRREIEIARKKAEEERKRAEAAERKRKEEERRLAAARAASTPSNNGTVYGSGNSRVILNSPSSGNNPGNNAGTARSASGTATPTPRTTTSGPAVASSTPAPRRAATPRAPVNLNLTPDAAALSSNFAANRGRLPWPVEKGYVISAFGTHKHPVAERVMVENSGIDIQTAAGATARAVFDGTVSKIFYVPGLGQNVIVNHGEYFTIYANLAGVSVSSGQAVKTKQAIGSVGNNEEGVPVLNFQVWKGGSKMNPAGWIAQ